MATFYPPAANETGKEQAEIPLSCLRQSNSPESRSRNSTYPW